jgi:Right handed beta helix region
MVNYHFMLRSIIFFMLLSGAHLAFGQASFYVATTGSNANPGTQAQPWQTIQYAANSATPGSTVYIMAGIYTEQIWMNVGGTAGNYITFTHFASDIVTIDGGSTNIQTVLLTIADQDYIRISGLHFANAMGNFSSGITVRGTADHIELLDNELSNIHFSTNPNAAVTPAKNVNPLIIYGDHGSIPIADITISGNNIHDCRTGYSEALTLNGNVDGFAVTGNTVHDITNIGIDMAGGYGVCADPAKDAARNGTAADNMVYNCVSAAAVAAGIYVDGGRDIVVEHNTVHDCGRGYEIGCEQAGKTASNIIVRNNIGYHNQEAAVGIGGYNYPSTGKVINSKLLNNTFYNNVSTNNGDGELLIEYTENCTIQNNLFYATNTGKRLIVTRLSSTGLALDYNLYFHTGGSGSAVIDYNGTVYTGFSNYQSGTGKDAHAIFGDPLMLNPAASDFHLGTGSPAANTGDPAFAPASGEVDIDGNARVFGAQVDIGADESSIVLDVSWGYFYAQAAPYGILLHWSTEKEQDNAYFIVERSGDALYFEAMSRVTGKKTSSTTQNYTFFDQNPLSGTNYYRLRQVDLDGDITVTDLVSADWQSVYFAVAPNPIYDQFYLRGNTEWTAAELTNALGQTIAVFAPGDQLSLSRWPSGVYHLVVFTGGQQVPAQVIRLVK